MRNPDYAAFLEATAWTHWATLTTVDNFSFSSLRRAAERHLTKLRPAIAFWAAESGYHGGRPHLHVLYSFHDDSATSDDLLRKIKKMWPHGRAEIQPFKHMGGAGAYLAKGLDRHGADNYDFWIDPRLRLN